MRHTSIKLKTPCEFIDIVPINPLISKCQIKVCYVGEQPNRNGSVITREVAEGIANSLPGSPIVGRYLEEKGDFEEHSRELVIEKGELKFVDLTQPYGFVDLGAKVWFQDFSDDGVTHTYLMTEGYIWTGRYPEAQRIIEKGNNQSMELDNENLKGTWAQNGNNGYEFFIINEAVISALCILGEDVEPCFEGATIGKVQFSLEEDFKEKIFSLMTEMKEILSKGGEPVKDFELENTEPIEEEVNSKEENIEVEEVTEYEVVEDAVESEKEEEVSEDNGDEEPVIAEEEETSEEGAEEAEEEVSEEYKLDEIPEYVQLSQDFASLQEQLNSVQAELQELKAYKLGVERVEKQKLIDKFYMLDAESKKEVVENIDTYSLDEIEAKLCVACFRNGVSFVDEKKDETEEPTTYNVNNNYGNATPDWVEAVEQHRKKY